MGDSLHPLGPRLGRLHAWRERGSMYVDGIRTSAQAAVLTAGVAKGADFTGTVWAVALGIGLFLTLESAKILAGWLDARFDVWSSHTQAVAEQNPIVMRTVEALERLSPVVVAHVPSPSERFHAETLPEPVAPLCGCSRKFTRHQTGCEQKIDGEPIRAVNVYLMRHRMGP